MFWSDDVEICRLSKANVAILVFSYFIQKDGEF